MAELMLLACLLMIRAGSGQVATYLVAFCLFWFCLGGLAGDGAHDQAELLRSIASRSE